MCMYAHIHLNLSLSASEAKTVGGRPIGTIDVNHYTLSELVRLYLEDRANADMNHVRCVWCTCDVTCDRPHGFFF